MHNALTKYPDTCIVILCYSLRLTCKLEINKLLKGGKIHITTTTNRFNIEYNTMKVEKKHSSEIRYMHRPRMEGRGQKYDFH